MEHEEASYFPGVEELLLKMSLYESIRLTPDNYKGAEDLKYLTGTIDAFCVECGQTSTFKAVDNHRSKLYGVNHMIDNHMFTVILLCSRNEDHRIRFIYQVFNENLIKIGQYPSMADFQFPELKKYRKILGDAKFKEFIKGVGLVSHGVGIGAFVYLRRVFEDLIEAAHQEAKTNAQWDDEKYDKSRMNEKIILLKSHLPEFLSENSSIYSILSKGIHALSEEECLQYFDAVKMGIEMILDEKLEQEARRKKAEIAKQALSSIHSKLK